MVRGKIYPLATKQNICNKESSSNTVTGNSFKRSPQNEDLPNEQNIRNKKLEERLWKQKTQQTNRTMTVGRNVKAAIKTV